MTQYLLIAALVTCACGVPAAAMRVVLRRRSVGAAALGCTLSAVAFVGLGITAIGIPRHHAAFEDFITDCRQHHKAYECSILWRAGGTVLFMPTATAK
ncbi:conserved protein of unknown function [Rhodovastum atsumiense]|uniref:Uncharacterized protein n=1 Tax=Rhodovastum atsumiense TaxID=504468 RepID=A0A5M6IQS8_9PROT|nr:hypothetical protein [Rhodovastum atsumiense]KAA5609825.1 hypothetical protein F1189_22305 [Rhodovastum atsumiense]CAH2603732.1 conserved protein of unknown function [Rhodovastum atsumiense]